MMIYMYGGVILQVDLSRGKVIKEPTSSYSGTFLGGRGINIKFLYDVVPPEIAALDPANLVIFGVGPLCGTPVPASRVEVTGKSPETGWLGSSNFGGYFGPELKFAGYDHIAITGKADRPVYLWVNNDQVEIRDASHLWGQDTYKTQAIIRDELGPEVKVACIGQAGENLVRFATVQSELGHGAGRTGMGAVMGSKNLKAIAVRGTKGITLANPDRYLAIAQELQQELRQHPVVQEKQKYGISRLLNAMSGRQDPVTGEGKPMEPDEMFLRYMPRRAGCYGCPTQCMDLYPTEAKGGGVISCSLYHGAEYVGSTDASLTLECALLAQRYGIDLLSTLKIIGWLMELRERGLITTSDTDGISMEWGNRQAIIDMFIKIVNREGFGNVLADGMVVASEKIGRNSVDYANHMKGLPMYSPSSPDGLIPTKGSALAMVMSSRGDTMRGWATEGLEDTFNVLLRLSDENTATRYTEAHRKKLEEIVGTEKGLMRGEYEGKPELVIYEENVITICDCLSACKVSSSFMAYPFDEECQAALVSVGTGIETNVETLFEFANRVRNLERAYCVREGMTRNTDSLPKRFIDHPIRKGIHKDEILESNSFEVMKDKYYYLRGWDVATGIPTRDTLEQAGLKDVARDLEKRGKSPTKSKVTKFSSNRD